MKRICVLFILFLSSVPLRAAGFELASNPHPLLPGGSAGYVHSLTLGEAVIQLSAGLWFQHLPLAERTEMYLEMSGEIQRTGGTLGVAWTFSPLLAAFEDGSVDGFASCAVLGLSLRHHFGFSFFPGGRVEFIPEPGLGWVVSGQGVAWVPDLILRLRFRYLPN